MASKQQGDEIGIASEEQENFDGQNVQMTPDMELISSLNISGKTQGT